MTDATAPQEDDGIAALDARISALEEQWANYDEDRPPAYVIRCAALRAAARISVGDIPSVPVVDKAVVVVDRCRVLEAYLRGPERED